MPAWSMIAGIHLETSFRRSSVGRPTFIRRAAVNNSYGVLYQENCKVWGLVHFSASKTLPLAKSVGRKHGPDPFRATLQLPWV